MADETLREKWLKPSTVALYTLMLGGGSGFAVIMLDKSVGKYQFFAWLALWLGYLVIACGLIVKRHLKLTAKIGAGGGEGGLELGDDNGT